MKERDKQLYMDLACRVAQQSYAVRLKVGAVFVSVDGMLAIGYNGTPSGWDNCCEYETDAGLITKPEVLHAESNAFAKIKAAGLSTKNGALFITHAPCIECAKEIYQSKIIEVYYKDVYRSMDGIFFLDRAGVKISQFGDTYEICHC